MSTKRRSWLKAGPLALLLAAGLASPVLGQSITASVTGVVEDNQGGVLKGASVTAVNQKTGVEYPTKTNDAGVYTVTSLPIGTYTLKAEAPGFKTAVTNPFNLETHQIARVPLKLELGAVTEELEVVGVNPVLQTESAVVGEVISGSTAVALPLNGRNFAQLTLLAPGVQHHDPQSFTSPKNFSGGRPYVNGNREQGNNFMLDGLDQNEAMDNLVAYNPSPDALAEIRIETNNYSAEFGNVAGAIISSVIKSGTNEIHGNAFEFMRNDKFDANSWENNRSGADKAELKQHIFGATIGGPLVKNKLFFFADYQGTDIKRPGGATASVAPDAWRTGDLSSLLSAGVTIRDPRTGQPFPGNRIPADRISPIARTLLADRANYPSPNATVSGTAGNLTGTQELSTKNHQGDLKLDANLGPKDNAFLRFSIGDFESSASALVLPVALATSQISPTKSVAASWSHAFSPSAVNELRLGYTNVKVEETFSDWAGIGNYNSTLGISGGQAIPGLSRLDFSSAGIDAIGAAAPNSFTNNNTLQFAEKLSLSKGKHFIVTGVQALSYSMERSYASNSGVLGAFTYSGQFTGNAFSDFLLDQVSQKALGGAAPWTHKQQRVGAFLQDDFKASSKLTLNLGVRWEYVSPLKEENDNQLNYNLQTGQAIFAGAIPAGACTGHAAGCVTVKNAGVNAYYGGFSPRVGFAWTVNDKTVIRGGYGMVQYQEGTGANNRLPQNPPFVPVDAVRVYTAAPGSAAIGFSDTATGSSGTVGAGGIRAVNPDVRPQLTHQWNFFIERQVSNSTSLSIGYVGHDASHLASFSDANQPLPGPANQDPSLWADAELRRPLKSILPNANAIRFTSDAGNSKYNGLQASLRRRRSKGLEFLASYTFSKAMQDNTGFYSAGWGATSNYNAHGPGDSHQNNREPEKEYGPSFFDTKHNFVLSGNYELPFGKGRSIGSDWSGVQQSLLGGWNLSAIFTARSGFPVTVTDGWNNRSLQPTFAFARPDRIGDGQLDGDWRAGEPLLDIRAFRESAPGKFGDAGVGILRGKGYYMLDMGLDKNFSLGGARALTLRLEAFNVLNHANPGMPNRDFSDKANFGKVTYVANAPRVLEFALKFAF